MTDVIQLGKLCHVTVQSCQSAFHRQKAWQVAGIATALPKSIALHQHFYKRPGENAQEGGRHPGWMHICIQACGAFHRAHCYITQQHSMAATVEILQHTMLQIMPHVQRTVAYCHA